MEGAGKIVATQPRPDGKPHRLVPAFASPTPGADGTGPVPGGVVVRGVADGKSRRLVPAAFVSPAPGVDGTGFVSGGVLAGEVVGGKPRRLVSAFASPPPGADGTDSVLAGALVGDVLAPGMCAPEVWERILGMGKN